MWAAMVNAQDPERNTIYKTNWFNTTADCLPTQVAFVKNKNIWGIRDLAHVQNCECLREL